MFHGLSVIQVPSGLERCYDRGFGGSPWMRTSGAMFGPASPATNTSPPARPRWVFSSHCLSLVAYFRAPDPLSPAAFSTLWAGRVMAPGRDCGFLLDPSWIPRWSGNSTSSIPTSSHGAPGRPSSRPSHRAHRSFNLGWGKPSLIFCFSTSAAVP